MHAGAGASLNLSLPGKVARGRTWTRTTRPHPTASSARARRPKPRPPGHMFSGAGVSWTWTLGLDRSPLLAGGALDWIGTEAAFRLARSVVSASVWWRGSHHPRQLWEGCSCMDTRSPDRSMSNLFFQIIMEKVPISNLLKQVTKIEFRKQIKYRVYHY
jgi:hypothetical protein